MKKLFNLVTVTSMGDGGCGMHRWADSPEEACAEYKRAWDNAHAHVVKIRAEEQEPKWVLNTEFVRVHLKSLGQDVINSDDIQHIYYDLWQRIQEAAK